MKLSVEVTEHDGVALVHCQGRVTYRKEAEELSRRVVELLQLSHYLILDLSGVEKVDSAGLGELVVLYMRAKANRCSFKLAAPRAEILELLQLTNLTSVLDVCPTVNDALQSFRERVA